ncbi:outer membrane lipoprotein-sorting protein [Vandammella animalimorsus]|uniref:Outer membrane lipoprotein-sorting protein n=1 Tax=Vandammella animalimorsus TaxID=2029117 RepID=A0A2A2B1R5_9BURK|nr:outer membrane lipoprotein-sorting protein [Vandammella animalimorsus]PAT43939.1 outer membrane lipoprotein-sorting protein [Vandammella animalimorsus]
MSKAPVKTANPLPRPLPHRRVLALAALAALSTLLAWPLTSARADEAVSDAQAQAWLARSDQIRNLPGSFALRNTLTEFRHGKQSAQSVLTVFARPAASGGQFDNLIRFESPARDHGKLMLRNGLELWFYDPSTRASVRISPQQRLLGQASNGDVMSTRLARDYTASFVQRETVRDGDRQERATLQLKLLAQRGDVPYAAIDYWIDASSHRPVMARYRSAEGRLLKTAYFRKYQDVLGEQRPTETVIIDGMNPDWVTLMTQSQHRLQDIPAAWMQRDYLPRFTGEAASATPAQARP